MELTTNQVILELLNISIDSGKEIMKIYDKDFTADTKEDSSPITEADKNSNELIVSRLKTLEPNIPILSEESLVSWGIRKKWNKYWLIDPLDGTKEFINRNGEFTINISLIENNKPVFGIIYSPLKSVLYYAYKNYGSFKVYTNRNLSSLNNLKKIRVVKKINKITRIVGSRSHSNMEFHEWVKNKFANFELIKIGSSLKFCLLAEGTADIYPRFGPTSEWDIAAGHIILQEAGGKLRSIDNHEILYNTKENILNPNFIAYGNISQID